MQFVLNLTGCLEVTDCSKWPLGLRLQPHLLIQDQYTARLQDAVMLLPIKDIKTCTVGDLTMREGMWQKLWLVITG